MSNTINGHVAEIDTAVQNSNEVYLVMLDIKNYNMELIKTKCIGVFRDKEKANEFANNCDTDKLIECDDYYSNCYIVPMEVK